MIRNIECGFACDMSATGVSSMRDYQRHSRKWRALARLYGAQIITLGGLSARELALQLYARIDADEVLDRAAQLSYYFVLALFPLLILLSTLLGNFFAAERGMYQMFMNYLGRVMPEPAFELMRDTLGELTEKRGAGTFTIGLALTLWTGSAGMEAVIKGLNIAYSVKEARPWWRRRLLAIGLTVALGGLVAMASFLILASDAAARNAGRFFPVLAAIGELSSFMQWAIGLGFLLLALTLIFRFAPNLRRSHWEANLPGAVLTLISWVVASAGFKLYLATFGAFNRTYGSLGAVIVLLVWLYVSGAALLIGGELNSVIWQAVLRARKE
ncbi:MAG: YihY/virulence factor BrkB family protein [Bryobacteraceae bacterium]